MNLELQPQREHDLPLQCSPQGGCTGNGPAALAIHTGEGNVEVNLVETVEDVGSKLNRDTFSQCEILCDGDVRLRKARPEQRVSCRNPKCARSRPLPWSNGVPRRAIWLKCYSVRRRKVAIPVSRDVNSSHKIGPARTRISVNRAA